MLVATHPLATNLLELHKPRTFGLILARFGHISATSRPFAVFYSTNRIYSASLTRLHAPPAPGTLGYYRNLKLHSFTGAQSFSQRQRSHMRVEAGGHACLIEHSLQGALSL